MDQSQLTNALEGIIFAVGEPITLNELKKILERAWRDDPAEEVQARFELLKPALAALKERWDAYGEGRGFELVEVAEGFTFRSNPIYSDYLRAMRDERPVRLSKAALETLAIVAYRQPATKPEIDHIRGVDCGGTLRLLIDRSLVRIVGKKEEPGRPLLYGTSKDFLSFFNISNLNQLPSLREYHELNEESKAELEDFDGGSSLEDLSRSAKQLRLEDEPAVQQLDEAVKNLDTQEGVAVDAFSSQGIEINPDDAPERD